MTELEKFIKKYDVLPPYMQDPEISVILELAKAIVADNQEGE